MVPKPNGPCTVLCGQRCSQRTQSYLVPVLVEADQEPWIEQRLGRCRNPCPWVYILGKLPLCSDLAKSGDQLLSGDGREEFCTFYVEHRTQDPRGHPNLFL